MYAFSCQFFFHSFFHSFFTHLFLARFVSFSFAFLKMKMRRFLYSTCIADLAVAIVKRGRDRERSEYRSTGRRGGSAGTSAHRNYVLRERVGVGAGGPSQPSEAGRIMLLFRPFLLKKNRNWTARSLDVNFGFGETTVDQ